MPSKQAFVSLFLKEIVTCYRGGFHPSSSNSLFPFHLPPHFLVNVGEFSCPSIQHRGRMSTFNRGVISGLIFPWCPLSSTSQILPFTISPSAMKLFLSLFVCCSLDFLSSFASFLVLYIRDKIKTIDIECDLVETSKTRSERQTPHSCR